MSRYIEYYDICSAINNQQDGTGMTYEALAHAMVEIQLAPSIDIVRCKECKHYFYDELNDCKMCYIHEYGEIWEDNDFCSYGEREGE